MADGWRGAAGMLGLGLALAQPAAATEVGDRAFGLGVVLGAPTGISGKLYLDGRTHALDMAVATFAWGPGRGGGYVHVTYLIHPSSLYEHPAFTLPWHIGAGGFVASGWGDTLGVGGRGVVGLDLDLHDYPAQFFLDVSLEMAIYPVTAAGLGIGLGGRWYF